MNTAEVYAALRMRYNGSDWAFFEEVHNATGNRHTASADAVAMSLWPSRGLELHGIEVKVSRGDWLRELKNPAKADAIFKYMDRWWIAAGDKDIVKIDELPPTWGLLIPHGNGCLKEKVTAPKLKPQVVTRPFLAALLRRVSEKEKKLIPESQIESRIQEAHNKGYESAVAGRDWSYRQMEKTVAEQKEVIDGFVKAVGMDIHKYNFNSVAEVIRLLTHFKPGIEKAYVSGVINHLKQSVERFEEVAKQYEAIEKAQETLKTSPLAPAPGAENCSEREF